MDRETFLSRQGNIFIKIINSKEFIEYFGKIEGETLKSAPKGYPKDHQYIEYLKLKSYLVTKIISDKELLNKDCFDLVIKASNAMKPLNDFLNDY